MSVSTLRVPLFTSLAEDLGRDSSLIFYVLVIALTGVVLAVKAWGLMALVMTALAFVPVMFLLLIWITIP